MSKDFEFETKRDSIMDRTKSFISNRTSFWINFTFELLVVVIPYGILWIFVGPFFEDYQFNVYHELIAVANPWVLIPICMALMPIALGINYLTYYFKWQQADSFTYTIGVIFFMMAIILTGIWINDIGDMADIWRNAILFFVVLAVGIAGVILGIFVSAFVRNQEYKKEEKLEDKKKDS